MPNDLKEFEEELTLSCRHADGTVYSASLRSSQGIRSDEALDWFENNAMVALGWCRAQASKKETSNAPQA